MKQLNHSPEAAAAVLGVSLHIAHQRIAWMRRQSGTPRGLCLPPQLLPPGIKQSAPEGNPRRPSTTH